MYGVIDVVELAVKRCKRGETQELKDREMDKVRFPNESTV
jgi:hypothetical protein